MGTEIALAPAAARAKARPQVRRVRPGQWTAEKRRRFLAALTQTANVREAARQVKMSDAGVYKLRARSAEFRAAWDKALAEGYGRLELMLLERAMRAVDIAGEIETGRGDARVREYSDKMAMSLLAAHRAKEARGGVPERPRKADIAAVRERIEARLAEMNERMGGDG